MATVPKTPSHLSTLIPKDAIFINDAEYKRFLKSFSNSAAVFKVRPDFHSYIGGSRKENINTRSQPCSLSNEYDKDGNRLDR